MSSDIKLTAKEEIHRTLRFCNFFIRRIGLSFIDEIPKTFMEKLNVLSSFVMASSLLILMLVGEYAYIVYLLLNSVSLEELIGSYLHIAGYDTMSKYMYLFVHRKRDYT